MYDREKSGRNIHNKHRRVSAHLNGGFAVDTVARIAGAAAFLCLITQVSLVSAQVVPPMIQIQGVLTDNSGVPLAGPVDLHVSVWDTESEGTELWQEDHGGVVLDQGTFSLELGGVTSLDLLEFEQGDALWLELTVDDEDPLSRVPFGSQPYCFMAENASTLAGYTAEELLAGTAVNTEYDNVSSNLAATDVQAALDELAARVDQFSILSERSIYVPAGAFNFTTGADLSNKLNGLEWPNTSQLGGFGVAQPQDWDKSTAFTVSLYFALQNATSTGQVSWRLRAGTSNLNLSVDYPDSGWDRITYSATQDAELLDYGNAGGHTYLMKKQTWTALWSETYHTYYFGSGVTTNNDFSDDPMWYFYFQRGASVTNGETYTGNMYVVGAEINYTAIPAASSRGLSRIPKGIQNPRPSHRATKDARR